MRSQSLLLCLLFIVIPCCEGQLVMYFVNALGDMIKRNGLRPPAVDQNTVEETPALNGNLLAGLKEQFAKLNQTLGLGDGGVEEDPHLRRLEVMTFGGDQENENIDMMDKMDQEKMVEDQTDEEKMMMEKEQLSRLPVIAPAPREEVKSSSSETPGKPTNEELHRARFTQLKVPGEIKTISVPKRIELQPRPSLEPRTEPNQEVAATRGTIQLNPQEASDVNPRLQPRTRPGQDGSETEQTEVPTRLPTTRATVQLISNGQDPGQRIPIRTLNTDRNNAPSVVIIPQHVGPPGNLQPQFGPPLPPNHFQHQRPPIGGVQGQQQPQFLRPQVNQQQVFGPQENQQQVFRPQENQQQVFRPQENQQQVFRPQDNQQQVFRPHENQQQVFRPQVNQQQVFRPQVNQGHNPRHEINQPQGGQPQVNHPQQNPGNSNAEMQSVRQPPPGIPQRQGFQHQQHVADLSVPFDSRPRPDGSVPRDPRVEPVQSSNNETDVSQPQNFGIPRGPTQDQGPQQQQRPQQGQPTGFHAGTQQQFAPRSPEQLQVGQQNAGAGPPFRINTNFPQNRAINPEGMDDDRRQVVEDNVNGNETRPFFPQRRRIAVPIDPRTGQPINRRFHPQSGQFFQGMRRRVPMPNMPEPNGGGPPQQPGQAGHMQGQGAPQGQPQRFFDRPRQRVPVSGPPPNENGQQPQFPVPGPVSLPQGQDQRWVPVNGDQARGPDPSNAPNQPMGSPQPPQTRIGPVQPQDETGSPPGTNAPGSGPPGPQPVVPQPGGSFRESLQNVRRISPDS